MKVLIVGGGIGGLTLAGFLTRGGVEVEIFEIAPQVAPVGLGVNLLPHAAGIVKELGLLDEMQRRSVTTYESTFFNRFGQHIYSEPAGLRAGYDVPQLSIHRADIQDPLLEDFIARAGRERLHLSHRCTGFSQDEAGVEAHFVDTRTSEALPSVRGDVLIGADGIHSVIRRQLHPTEGDPVYSGVNMWRGATVWKPFLNGANMTRVGWLSTGKLVIYPIRNNVDGEGNQLINWVVELETPQHKAKRDWNKEADLADFWDCVKDMKFDWLDIPALIRSAEKVLEFPMVDQEPLPFWTQGRVTLLGDAAHPMYPRGSNGAGQAIIDGKALGERLVAAHRDEASVTEALSAYQDERLPATTQVVLTNRSTPPDIVLKVVHDRTGDQPFDRIEDVVSQQELHELVNNYKRVAGYDRDSLKAGTKASSAR
jgi:2-polyprenyl-6-methoxyphenol hydroxylase-like FAD-dependent oxidoreductase